MIFEYPDLVRSFTCIADRCPDTCCRGWEVDIDSETEQYYRSVPGPLGERLRHALSVSEEDGSTYFPLTRDGACPFLTKTGLCDIITELGEAAISRVCTEYPRYFVQIGGYEQMDMSLSCMEYGRIFFAAGPMHLIRTEREVAGDEMDAEDAEYLRSILQFRNEAVSVMQDGDGTWRERLAAVGQALTGADTQGWLPGLEEDQELFRRVRSLELLDERWRSIMDEVEALPFENAPFGNEEQTDRWFTKLGVYFLFRYMIDSYFDGGGDGVIRFTSRSLRYIWLMCLARAKRLGRMLTDEDLTDIAHLYSRQVEHSEENVAVMKEA
ncbi:MAG: flagellin lysine-N-methylase [Chordicoccus sp.]